MDVAYALLVEHYQQVGAPGLPMVNAIEALNQVLSGEHVESENGDAPAEPTPAMPTAADNDRAMAELMATMQGVT